MAKLKRAHGKRLVLDIGSSAVRLCELSQTKAGYQLTKYHQREFGIDPVMSEDEKQAKRLETLNALLKDAKVRTRKAVFGVPGQSVFVRTRTLPPVPEHKVTQIVRYEIQQQIPFALDQIALDYQVLARTEAGGYDVLMTAIKVDVVEKHISLLRQAKRSIHTVDVCPLAAYNWLKYTGEFGEEGECVALLDFGASTTDIVIEREGQFRMNRSLNIGGNDITAALSSEFNISFAEAERVKRERGFAPTGDPKRDGKGGEVVGRVLGRLVAEINRSFAYFRSQPGGGPVSRVIVTGGGACLRNIIPYFQRQLGVEVRIAQPLAGLAIAPTAQEVNEHPEQAAVVLGLALRHRQTVPIEVNLIPPRILEAARHREQAFYWALSFVTLALIMLSIIPERAKANERVKEQIELIKMSLGQYDRRWLAPGVDPLQVQSPQVGLLRQVKEQVKGLEDRVAKLDDAYKARSSWLRRMAILANARKGLEIWFSRVETVLIVGGESGTVDVGGTSRGLDDLRQYMTAGGSGGGGGGVVPAIPFPGLRPQTAVGQSGAVMMTGSRRRDDVSQTGAAAQTLGMGAMAPNQLGAETQVEPPLQPNGICVIGYGRNPDNIKQFVENLKKSGEFLENGVYFDERLCVRMPEVMLADPYAYDSARGALGNWIPRPNEPIVYSFRVDLQLSGTVVDVEAYRKALAERAMQTIGSGRKDEEEIY